MLVGLRDDGMAEPIQELATHRRTYENAPDCARRSKLLTTSRPLDSKSTSSGLRFPNAGTSSISQWSNQEGHVKTAWVPGLVDHSLYDHGESIDVVFKSHGVVRGMAVDSPAAMTVQSLGLSFSFWPL